MAAPTPDQERPRKIWPPPAAAWKPDARSRASMAVRHPAWPMTSNWMVVGAAAAGALATTTSSDAAGSSERGRARTAGSYLPRGKAANSPGAALAACVCRGGHGYETIDLLAGEGGHPVWRGRGRGRGGPGARRCGLW